MRVLTMMACGLALCLGSAVAAPDEAGEIVVELLKPDTAGQPAVVEDEDLARVLALPGSRPWRLSEHLLARGRPDVARRLAAQTDETALGPLAAYVQRAEVVTGAPARLALFLSATAAHVEGEHDRALALLTELQAEASARTVFGVRAARLRGQLLRLMGRRVDGSAAWLEGAESALRIGWWAEASTLFYWTLAEASAIGSYELANRAAEGSRAVLEAMGSVPLLARAEYNLAEIALRRGDLLSALRHYDEARHFFESLGDESEVAIARSGRSYVLARLGEFAEALAEQRELAVHFDRVRKADPDSEAWLANQSILGLIYQQLGDEQQALRVLSGALDALKGSGRKSLIAGAHDHVGQALWLGEQWDEAIASYRKAKALRDEIGEPMGAAVADHNLAEGLHRRADSALADLEATANPDERRAIETSARLALEQARALVAHVIPIAEASGAAGLRCAAQLTLGEILLSQGKQEEAERMLRATRDEAERLQSWRSRMLATILLARLCLGKEDWSGAAREAGLAVEMLGRSFAGLAHADLARARAHLPDAFDIGVTAALRMDDHRQLMKFLEAGRAAALLRGLGGRSAAMRAVVSEALQEKLAARQRATLDAYLAYRAVQAQTSDFKRIRASYVRWERAKEQEQETVKDVDAVRSQAAGRLAPSRLQSIRELQGRLRATTRRGVQPIFAVFNFQATQALALVVEARGKSRVATWEGPDLQALRAALATLAAAHDGELDPAALEDLRRLLIKPLLKGDGPTRLFICPDRELAYAPLSAVLPDDCELVWEPSATTYDLLAERSVRTGRAILGLGNPDYSASADPSRLIARGGPLLAELLGSDKEIRDITQPPRDQRLLGAAATESGFAEALQPGGKLRSWRSVHLACHGFVDVERPEFSCLALTPGAGEDGLLTSSEILRLSMRTDLAVLSACRTGRGRFVRSEGLMGLTRAFMFAGAPRVIVSLWDVNDQATAHLMKVFYGEMDAGRDVATALRTAQLAVRDHEVKSTVSEAGEAPRDVVTHPWRDPAYWAAWVLWGLPD